MEIFSNFQLTVSVEYFITANMVLWKILILVFVKALSVGYKSLKDSPAVCLSSTEKKLERFLWSFILAIYLTTKEVFHTVVYGFFTGIL